MADIANDSSICYIKQYDLTLISLWDIVDNVIEPSFINDCHDHGLLTTPLKKNTDVMKLLYHNFILHICNQIIDTKKGHVAFYLTNKMPDMELVRYMKRDLLLKTIRVAARKISKILPITFIEVLEYESLKEFCDDVHKQKGEAIDLLKTTLNKIAGHKKKQYSLRDAKKFTQSYQLYFLNKEYFDRLKVKSLLSIR